MSGEFDGTLDEAEARWAKPWLFVGGDMSQRTIVFDRDLMTPPQVTGCRIAEAGYGWVIEDDANFSEWAFVVQFTCRQDGRTSWTVVLTDVDGVSRVKQALSRTVDAASAIASAVTDLCTFEAHWVQPIRTAVAEVRP